MSQDASRTSSQDTGESIVSAKKMLTMKEISVWQPKIPVKTALHQAVTDGRIHQARLLSTSVTDVDAKDINGWTPLMLTCNAKKDKLGSKMFKIFIERGAKINNRDKMGRTPLMVACLSSNERVVRVLLAEDGLEISAQDNDGNTALIHAAMKRKATILNMMLKKVVSLKLSVDTRNQMGYTALLLSCKLGNFNNALSLLTVGTSCPYIRDLEYKYCARDWITWYKYKQHQDLKEKHRFPHLIKQRSMTNIEDVLPEEESMRKLLGKIYQPTLLKPKPLPRSLSLPADTSLTDLDTSKNEEQQIGSMQALKEAICRLEEEHEAERERLYFLQAGRTTRGRSRDISTAKLRSVAESRKYESAITLPQIFSLYALSHREKCDSHMGSSMRDITV